MKKINLQWLYILLVLLPFGLWSCEEENEPDQNNEFEREVEVNTETTKGKIVINESYVPIDWNKKENHVTVADTATGRFVVQLGDDEEKTISKGDLLTLDVDSTIFLRKVTAVKKENGQVELETRQAYLEEIFAGSNFEIRIGNPKVESNVLDSIEAVTRAEGGTNPVVIYPSEIRYQDENGVWHKEPYGATRTEEGWQHWDVKVSKTLNVVGPDDGPKPNMGVSFSLGVGLDYAFALTGDLLQVSGEEDYATKEEAIAALERSKAKWKPTFYLDPTITGTADLFFHFPDYEKEKKGTRNGDTVWEKVIVTVTAMVGIVPVAICIAGGFDFDNTFKVSGGMDVSTKIDVGLSKPIVAGAYKSSSGWKGFFDMGKLNVKMSFPAISFGAELDDEISFSPKVSVLIYGMGGPYAKILPTFHANVAAGAGFDFGRKELVEGDTPWNGINPDLGWNATLGFVPKWSVGVGASKLLGGGAFETKPREIIAEKNLLTAPESIECLNPEDAKIGELCEMKFKVNSWFSYIVSSTRFGSWVPVPVLFQDVDRIISTGNKEIQEDADDPFEDWFYELSDWGTGEVSVFWKPTDENSFLMASIRDSKGMIISDVTVKPNMAPANVKTVDLGTGVLWANMNVGAAADYDLGDLVGWGDDKGTNTRQWIDSKYGDFYEGMEYCLDWYGGLHRDRGIGHGRYDYATAKWGGGWQMPAKSDWDALISKCKWEWMEDRHAFKVSGNGNYIYLPAVGYEIGKQSGNLGISCEYWSASLDTDTKEWYSYNGYDYFWLYPNAWYFYAENGQKTRTAVAPRCFRHSIRPIYRK